ncbi:MAG: dTDP-4-dehydrorhamnose reductase [bacterium]|jgi:dTDP-4-dehydrorhamnose reductase|nr:dTDP-4-dehydrorhamnose reductase [bacterium]
MGRARVLVTGAQGQLGRDLCRLLPDAVGLGHKELSVTDPEAVLRCIRDAGADLVCNCAAYNAVDAAEQDPALAQGVNAEGPALIAEACREANAGLVHFSTNYVFSGEQAEPATEDDQPDPRSAYARSKLEGERRVLGTHPSALVVRCAGLYGLAGSAVKGGSFPARILERARSGAPLRVVDDQWLNPTFTRDLAAGVVGLLGQDLEGVVHLAADGCCSWWEFATETLKLAGVDRAVERISTDALAAPAPRPRHGCLASRRVRPLRSWREGLAEFVREAVATGPS